MAELITMLALSPTMDEGTLVAWLKREGDSVEEGELIAEIETDKATMDMESFFEGTVLKLIASVGEAIPVGAPLAIIGEAGEDFSDVLAGIESGAGALGGRESVPTSPSSPDVEVVVAPETSIAQANGRVVASPVAKKMATQNGLNIAGITGSGPGGRIIKRDVESALTKAPAASASTAFQPAAAIETQLVPLSQMRKTIAKRLTQVWQSTPHFFLTATYDMANVMAFRAQVNTQLKETEGIKISVNDIIVKACGVALIRYPRMNVAYQGDHIAQYGEAHIGVAVAIPDGLITPIVRNADQKTLTQISREIRELAGRAREKRLKPDEYTGSTFSVSNLGMFGIDHFHAIINPPEAGILACGAVQQEPVVVGGELAVGTRMTVTLSCDHRSVDGVVGAEFLQELRRLLENPMLLVV